jgi:signal transduction histidine kinase
MFKKFGDFIHRTPWWAMILLGFSVLLLLVAFSVPTHVFRLAETGATPEEKRAIKREIDRAMGDSALGLAENVVRTIQERTNDPARRVEMERALEQIAEARAEMYAAKKQVEEAAREASSEAERNAIEAAAEAQRTAIEAAIGAANSNAEAAAEARVAVEEAKQEAAEKLKNAGADAAAALRAFDDMIRAAKDKERQARDQLRKLKDARKRGVHIGVDKSSPAIIIEPDKAKEKSNDKGKAPTKGEGVNVDGTIGGQRVTGKVDLSDGTRLSIDFTDSSAPSAPSAPSPPSAKNAPPPPPPAPPTLTINGEKIALSAPSPPSVVLPPELREAIKSTVRQDVRRVGVGSVLVLIFVPLFIMTLIAKYFIDRSRLATAFAEQKKKEAEQSNVNRQIVEARLQALQAQVEPHFLYNTLANVQALTEVDPNQANQMTGHLIQYLRSALPKMRESTSTIGQEIELVRAYLNILKMRMGSRLEFGIDCAEDLLATPFPPLMLPSLVENAIKHGLEPQKEGGRVDVVVTPIMTALGKRLRVEVRDTGKGLSDAPTTTGTGVGLGNIRERLHALYGDGDFAGKLTLESNEPRGVIATLEVPVDPPTAATSPASAPPKPQPPQGWWGKTRYAVATSHGVWAKIMSKTFIVLMVALAIVFGLALAALYSGLMPLNIGDVEFGGVEGMALGTVVLLVAFGIVALVLLAVVGLLYGLGLLVAGLLIIIPLIIVISVFPAVAPFILVGALVYWWFVKRKREKNLLR